MAGWIGSAVTFTYRTGRKLALPLVAVPMGMVSVSITLACCGFLLSYVLCCISWWTCLAGLGVVWRGVTGAPHPRTVAAAVSRRQSRSVPDSLRKLSSSDGGGGHPSAPGPRRIATPHRRLSTAHASRECLVGDGTDRDFEGLGGWARSTDDDEALYMAKTFGQEPCFDDVTRSTPRYRRLSAAPSGPTSPLFTRPPTGHGVPPTTTTPGRHDDERILATGTSQHQSYQSRSSSPGAYFALPPSRSTASLPRVRMGTPTWTERDRRDSSFVSLAGFTPDPRDVSTPWYDS